ncbi:hypothetical protein GCM10011416_11020 [Polaribacter pacificus]|uniref:Rieske domain-containing protein n=1 Tax=Polaribacter pacificus TaxID=1775173 RepID=A0A917MCZ9_9FLAO|nr:Rieske 2Fe-2S domain-containing protein [Polaribacter pacificus]GGG95308.1 hypothetical protein GCM10011416_11020 [Polaribacter pacificus]
MQKKIILSLLFLTALISCTKSSIENDLLPNITVNETVNLNLPKFINLQVPGGSAYISGGVNGIVIYKLNNNEFKAFDRACPHLPVSSCTQMVIKNTIKLVCPCDDSEFNILNGSPLTEGITHYAREYLVTVFNANTLRITNF